MMDSEHSFGRAAERSLQIECMKAREATDKANSQLTDRLLQLQFLRRGKPMYEAFSKMPVVSGSPKSPTHRLAEQHMALLRHILMRRFSSLCADEDKYGDAFAVGWCALLRAAENWDPKRGSFSTYAYPTIAGSVSNWLRSERAANRLIACSLDAPSQDDEGESRFVEWLRAPRSYEPHSAVMSSSGFSTLLDEVDDRQRVVLQKIYEEGETVTEAAAHLGVSRSLGSLIHRRALARLAKRIRIGDDGRRRSTKRPKLRLAV
jgi:RNA polymerase sigma factor (sigma-70 family)